MGEVDGICILDLFGIRGLEIGIYLEQLGQFEIPKIFKYPILPISVPYATIPCFMHELFKQAAGEIKRARRIAVITHHSPDGDALGSLLAMGRWLGSIGKSFSLYCVSNLPSCWEFLPDLIKIKTGLDEQWSASDTVIVLDCGDLTMPRVEDDKFSNKNLVVFDHHATNSKYGRVNAVDPGASATAEIIFKFFLSAGYTPDRAAANCLLTGVYTDTDAFSNLATTAESLRVASELLKLGADLKEISANTIQNKSVTSLKLWGRALERLRLHKDKGIAVAVLKQEDFRACQAGEEDAEGVANLMNNLKDVKLAMVLREKADGTVKGSLRTTDNLLDVSKIAKLFGGGGHAKAAGFTVKGRIVEKDGAWEVVS